MIRTRRCAIYAWKKSVRRTESRDGKRWIRNCAPVVWVCVCVCVRARAGPRVYGRSGASFPEGSSVSVCACVCVFVRVIYKNVKNNAENWKYEHCCPTAGRGVHWTKGTRWVFFFSSFLSLFFFAFFLVNSLGSSLFNLVSNSFHLFNVTSSGRFDSSSHFDVVCTAITSTLPFCYQLATLLTYMRPFMLNRHI